MITSGPESEGRPIFTGGHDAAETRQLAPQTPLTEAQVVQAADLIMANLISKIPAGTTEAELRFGKKGNITIRNDGRAPQSATGQFMEKDGLRSTAFEITSQLPGLQSGISKLSANRFPTPMSTPDKYHNSRESIRHISEAIAGLFHDGESDPEYYDQLTTTLAALGEIENAELTGYTTHDGISD